MKKVALFYGCYTNFYRPDIGHETIRLLSFFNIDVVLPRQWCCGLPALGNGNLTLARFFAQKNAASLSNYIDAGYDIVYNCTSCGQAILHDYANILKIAQAKKIAENTYNVHEYIVKLMDEGYIKPQFQEVHRKLAYHIPCHLRALGIGYPAAKLMSLIPGLTFEILDDACCGLSGSYGLKKSNGDTSMQIGKRAVVHIKNTGAAAIVADCGSCRMQLGGLSGLTTLDPVEVLSEALRITEIRARK